MKMWCDSKRLNRPLIQYPCRNESSQVQFGSSDNVIKVLLSLSVFLTHHHHQQHFVSIHLPPHPPGLCVPEVTKEKQRYSLITTPLKMNTLTSFRTLLSGQKHKLYLSQHWISCHFFLLYCNGTQKGRRKRMIQFTVSVFLHFPPWIERKRSCSVQKKCKYSILIGFLGKLTQTFGMKMA